MSKGRLKHSLEELFSDFAPPTPEGEAEPANLPPRSSVQAAADTLQEPTSRQKNVPPGRQLSRDDAPRQRNPYETRPLLEQENVDEEKESGEDEKTGQKDNSPPEDTMRTWRAGWRDLASENTNGKGRSDPARGSIGIRRRRLIDGRPKPGEGKL